MARGIGSILDRPRAARLAFVLAFAAAASAVPAAEGESAPGPSFSAGRWLLELRPRYNLIEESNKPERAEGWTLRAAAGWQGAAREDLRLTLEAIATAQPGAARFNDDPSQAATSPYPLLPDPRHAGLNRAFVDYTGLPATRIRAGRQVVRLNNQRFVSDNDFRQVPQLFDGVAATWTGLENAELHAAWYGNQRATSGEEDRLNLTLANAAWNPAPDHGLAAYAVFHDEAQNGASTGFADNSYRVLGVRAEGLWRARLPVDVSYVAEWASQRSFSGGDARIDADYWRLGAGVGTERWTLRYDEELKGSNNGLYGLQTPLTDFYAFNGWTLHFFNTPRAGLRDRWATGRLQLGAFVVYGEEHRFRSDYGDLDYGRETDLGLTWVAWENCIVRLQYARYRPGSRPLSQPSQAAVTKTWLTLTYTY